VSPETTSFVSSPTMMLIGTLRRLRRLTRSFRR
jgi:hypothetical protein